MRGPIGSFFNSPTGLEVVRSDLIIRKLLKIVKTLICKPSVLVVCMLHIVEQQLSLRIELDRSLDPAFIVDFDEVHRVPPCFVALATPFVVSHAHLMSSLQVKPSTLERA